jgi:hypothetical protein
MNNQKIAVEDYEFVEVVEADYLRIQKMNYTDAINLVITGCVNEIKTGTQETISSRMPSLLQWLYASKPLALLIGLVIPIGSTVRFLYQRCRANQNE